MEIDKRLARYEDEDAIIIGDVVRSGLNGDFGKLILAIIGNFKSIEIQTSMGDGRSSDKVLGRLEGYENVLVELRNLVAEMERLKTPLPQQEPESSGAVEQMEPSYHGGGQV